MKQVIEPIYKIVGAKIAYVRTALGWTQLELAKKTGFTRATIANIEGGNQRLQLHTIECFAKVFGIETRHFMKGIWS